jgi:hypothetical protein
MKLVLLVALLIVSASMIGAPIAGAAPGEGLRVVVTVDSHSAQAQPFLNTLVPVVPNCHSNPDCPQLGTGVPCDPSQAACVCKFVNLRWSCTNH